MKRRCSVCSILKNFDRSEWVWSRARGPYSTVCKQCHAKKCKRIAAKKLENPEYRARVNSVKRTSREDPAQRARDAACTKTWQANNKLKVGRKAQAMRCPYKRRAEERFLLQEAYALAKLRTKLTGIKWCVDHIVPLNGRLVSGLHVIENIQVITKAANSVKFNKFEVQVC